MEKAYGAATNRLPPLMASEVPKPSPEAPVCPSEVELKVAGAPQPRQMPLVLLHEMPEGHAAQAAPAVPHAEFDWLA